MNHKKLGIISGMAFTLLFMVNCAPAQFDQSSQDSFDKPSVEVVPETTSVNREGTGESEVPAEVPPSLCMSRGSSPYQSGSLIGTAYHYCITDPVESAGLSVGTVVTPTSPAPIHFSLKMASDHCCSKKLEVTAMASGCVLGIVQVACQ